MNTELGLAVRGFLGLGDFGKVSHAGIGGDATVHLVRDGGGFGLRAAAGVHLLQGYKIPTGEVIFNGTSTQSGEFVASQDILWVAVGPAWSRPVGIGRIALYLMGGGAIARARSSQAWSNTLGADPGITRVPVALAGVAWSPRFGDIELGAELIAGGRAAFWDNPPAVVDGAGDHVLRGRTASITGLVIRMGCCFGV
jgi:hypothetical protein